MVWQLSVLSIQDDLDLSELNLDGTHSLANKGGEAVAYQGRKKAKTSNILPIMDANGYILASTNIVEGNHHDAFELKEQLQGAFKSLKRLGLDLKGAFFNADSAFDTKDARKTCFNHGVVPNIAQNKRNRKRVKRGRPRLYNKEVYKHRFVAERSFASGHPVGGDKFKSLLLRFERKDTYFFAAHAIVFAMINLRHLIT